MNRDGMEKERELSLQIGIYDKYKWIDKESIPILGNKMIPLRLME